jgi:cytochrome c-type biogenesis protein CcmH/NrfG
MLRNDETDDEAEIQFRAAFVFYQKGRWDYAVPAFAEVVDYDDDRIDARFYWAASLVMSDRDAEAAQILEELLETPFEMRARPLLARVLFRQGKWAEARAAAAPAAKENFDAAGWVARYDLIAK